MYKIVEFTRHGNAVQVIVRLSDGANIPFDSGNADYQAYELWVSEGNTAPVEQV